MNTHLDFRPQVPALRRSAVAVAAAIAAVAAPSLAVAQGSTTESAPTSVQTTADKVPASDGEAAIMAAALAQSSSDEGSGNAPKVNIYGFADFTYTTKLGAGLFSQSPYDTFSAGNFNVYVGSELGDNWRTLSEVRFMFLPNGTVPSNQSATNTARTNTTVADYTDLGRPKQWGGISIERVYLERTFHKLLTVRAGRLLTPYGIWNVDHGSPVIIGVMKPYIVGEEFFPAAQTGLELYGTYDVGETIFGYHLTLSNGRGPLDSYQDLDHNKAIGWRLFAKNDSLLGTLTVGFSGYRGTYTDRQAGGYTIDSSGKWTVPYTLNSQYKELNLAGDIKWEYRGIVVQSEVIVNEIAYPEAARPALMAMDGGPPGLTPDHRRWGMYGLAGYRTPWFGIMPFFGGEYYWIGNQSFVPASAAVWGGLNVRPTARVVLKAQVTYARWIDTATPADPFQALNLQAAWSF